MLDRVEERFDLKPRRLAADTAYGTGKFLGWLVKKKKIIPHIPVWEMSDRQDGIFSRSDFHWDRKRGAYICPSGKLLMFAGVRILHGLPHRVYEAGASVCAACCLKPQCCPRRPAREVRQIQESAAMQDYLQRMQDPAMQELYKKRAAVAEYPNLWMKHMRKWRRFSVRGKAKACREALWRALSYNAEQWIRAFRTTRVA